MARRSRVPRHKSGRRKRNKNPKLSPFQLEQKRARLANQPPTPKTIGTNEDIPHSQRGVFEYLQAKRARIEEKRREKRQEENEKNEKEPRLGVGTKSSEDVLRENKEEEEEESGPIKNKINCGRSSLHDLGGEKKAKKAARRACLQEGASSFSCGDCADSLALKRRKTAVGGSSLDHHDEGTEESETENDDEDGKRKESVGTSGALSSATENNKKQSAAHSNSAVSLNREFLASVGAPMVPSSSSRRHRAFADGGDVQLSEPSSTVEEIIARKKEKKHRKKAQARRERVAGELRRMEEELSRLISKKARKKFPHGDPDLNVAFEKKLKALQQDGNKAAKSDRKEDHGLLTPSAKKKNANHKNHSKEKEEESGGGNRKPSFGDVETNDDHDPPLGVDSTKRRALDRANPAKARKRILFDDGVEGFAINTKVPSSSSSSFSVGGLSRPRRPKDFTELLDIPKFGERVEAPPVFEVVPNPHAAVTRLANKLSHDERKEGRNKIIIINQKEERKKGPGQYQFLATQKGGVGEEKRLARLGLAPAITRQVEVTPNGTFDHARRPSSQTGGVEGKKKEMELLREHVMATYRQSRRNNFTQKKGVDMNYTFPKFSP